MYTAAKDMEERIMLSILLDLYGELLTEKQKEVMTYYYNDDLSLAEIGELTNTSRQAIHDIIKRCHNLLLQYEGKLQLYEKEKLFNDKKEDIVNKLKLINTNDDNVNKLISEIIDDINVNL